MLYVEDVAKVRLAEYTYLGYNCVKAILSN